MRPAAALDSAAGGVPERSKGAVLKTAEPEGSVGSNPTPAASPLRTSQEKAERFFAGGRFWQIPGALDVGDVSDPRLSLEHLSTAGSRRPPNARRG
jgi:hypothetical protein